ncbi:uncharacterized protein [Nicotiana sylvestris]|uniref:uncharacterized protein n=1 Tax=Nicotiana sylvestris TaxID=4096 RepID=UPI00388C92A0
MSFLGRLNYISRFIAQSTVICEPIFKMMRKEVETSWTKDYQKAFDKIKEYLSRLPVLVPSELGRHLLLYLSMIDGAFGCVLGQQDKTGRKEKAIYYLSKKFTPYGAQYLVLERICCALTWTAQKLRHYFYAYITYLISRMDPLKYIFQKPMPTGKLAKWQIVLREDITEAYDDWRIFFDGAANFKGAGIGAVLVLETGSTRMATKNSKILPYLHHVQELKRRFIKKELRHVPRIQNEFADALAYLSSMIQHPDKNYIDPILMRIHNQLAYCAYVEEEADGKPWFHDIKEYLSKGEYLEHANHIQKQTPMRLSNHFFHIGGNMYRITPDMGLLRCVDAKEASKLLEDVHVGTSDPHMNGFVLAKKILRAEAASYKAVTKKLVADFVKDRFVYRFRVPESIITDNVANLNSDLMKAILSTISEHVQTSSNTLVGIMCLHSNVYVSPNPLTPV